MQQKPISEKNFWQRLPIRWRVIFVLAALICASYFVRNFVAGTPEISSEQRALEAKSFRVENVFEETEELGNVVKSKSFRRGKARVSGVYVSKLVESEKPVKIAFAEFSAGTPSAGTPILLIHGLGRSGASLYDLAAEISSKTRRKIFVPDLPGAGASARESEDFSAEAPAGTLFSDLDVLGAPAVEVLGFGNGGAVAIFMAHQQSERVSSLSLISSVGAQEFELLGNHIVNKIVYTFALGFFKFAEDIFPHFGLLDRGNVNKAAMRILWDSDVSDLKKYLHDWQKPLFLAHGESDLVAPFSAAEYTKKLVPAAETFFVKGGHGVFLKGAGTAKFADAFSEFLEKIGVSAEREKFKNAAGTTAGTSAGTKFPPIETADGARVLVLMLIILICTFVAEDPTCLAAGLLVAQGLLGFVPALLACLLGIFIGDLTLYLIGRFLGRPILRKPPFKWIVSEQQIDEMSERFEKNPKSLAIIVSSRFIPGSRLPTFIAAGVMKLNWRKLIFLFFVAAALWTPPLILLAEKVGAGVIEQFKEWHHAAAEILILAIVILYLATHYIVPAFTWRGRRRHVMLRRKITRHEFWPHFVLGVPAAFQNLFLALRYRSFTLFTLSGIGLGESGGFPGGSKFENYKNFLGNDEIRGNDEISVKTVRVPAEKDLEIRWENALKILKNEKIAFPCVLKPEIGDGGIGVCIVQNSEHLKAWLEANLDDAIAQEFARGNEYEVIWARLPGKEEGRIQSVIQKDFVNVKGDGERKLDELIWADDAAVPNGNLLTRLHFRDSQKILNAGELFPLAPTGTRIKGARYISRPELRAGTLSKKIDEIANRRGNVHYVCLDIRCSGDEALFNGEKIKITSVKGAGAASSAIFDGYVRMGRAYARIFKQLNFCFAVGNELRKRGEKPRISPFKLFEIWGTARGRSDNYVKFAGTSSGTANLEETNDEF